MAFDVLTWLEDLQERAEAEGRAIRAQLAAGTHATVEIVQGLVVDFAPRNAAALAYTTILSIVPLLAVSFGLIKTFVAEEKLAGTVRTWLLHTLFADSIGEVSDVLEAFLERAQGGAVGLIGFAFLLFTSLSLFLSIERTLNLIWRVPMTRPLHRRLITFYSIITLAPALIGMGFVLGSWLKSGLEAVPFGLTVSAAILPLLLEFMALSLMFKLMPHTPVKWRSAAIGGLLSAIGFEFAKGAFNLYINAVYTGSVSAKIYGSFALIPVFFLWIYLSWIIVLSGAQVAYLTQNRTSLTRALMSRRGRRGEFVPPTGYLVARVFLIIARHFRDHGGGIPPNEVAAQLQIPIGEVQPAIALLREGNLLLGVEGPESDLELVPARPLDRIRLVDLYARCEEGGYHPGELPAGEDAASLEAHLAEVERGRQEALDRTVASFLAPAGA